MAIKVSGVNVIDNERNFNVGVVTATTLDVPPQAITFSPTDGSSDNALDTNIVITYNTDIEKGSGNITLRDGSASGTVIQTIAVSSGTVSISGGAVTINPSDFSTGKDIYVVVDEGAFTSSSLGSGTDLLDTYNFTTGPITVSSFNPTDGATDVAVDSNIIITFSENIAKGSGNITLRAGSASGTIRQTIDVTSGAVTVSGTQAIINPSDFQYEEDTYVVVDAGCFTNTDGDAASGNAVINTYNFTTAASWPVLGAVGEGGYLICMSGGNLWIVAPSSTEVMRSWYARNDAVTTANSNAACGDWFIPSKTQVQNPGYICRTYWDYSPAALWSNTESDVSGCSACRAYFLVHHNGSSLHYGFKSVPNCVRAFRCVSY